MAKEKITTVVPQRSTSINVNPFDSADVRTSLTSIGSVSSQPKLILSKTVTADSGYYYPTAPTLTLVTEDRSRYFIETKNKIFTDNKYLNSITFDIYFLFTGKDVKASDGDSFNIISNPKAIPVKTTQYINDVVIMGEPTTNYGGTRTIKVHGDPGSTVNVVLKGDDGLYYDWNNKDWSTIASTKMVTIPSADDFEGFQPTDYILGVYTEEVRFLASATKITHTASISPTADNEIKAIKELGIATGSTVELEDVQATPVTLTISGTTDAIYTFNAPLILGPFTANQPCEVEILRLDGVEYGMSISETSASAGEFSECGTPIYPKHWSNATENTLSGWEFSITATVVDSTATNAKILLSGTVLKAGSVSLETTLDLGEEGLGAGLLPYA